MVAAATNSSVAASDRYTATLLATGVTRDTVGLGDVYATQVVKRVAVWEFCAVTQYTTLAGELRARLAEGLRVSDSASFGRRSPIQYAVNVATGAVTTYEGFDFTAFALVGDTLYGSRADGVYRLAGADDNGTPIDAWVDFGGDDMDSTNIKQVDVAWLGLDTDAQCFLRVTADSGRQRVYQVQGAGTRRSKLGSGVRGRTWYVTLSLVGATYAALDFVELNVSVTTRRLTRQRP